MTQIKVIYHVKKRKCYLNRDIIIRQKEVSK